MLVVELLPGAAHGWPEADRYVRSELAQAELEGVVLPLEEIDDELALVRAIRAEARRRDALAAVLLLRERGPAGVVVRVWIADEVTGKLVSRELPVQAEDPSPADAALAAVELLHASLVEIRTRVGPARPPRPPAPPAAEAFVARRAPQPPAWRLELALGVTGPLLLDGFSPSLGPRLGLGLARGGLFLDLGLWLGALPARRDEARGEVAIGSAGALVWAGLEAAHGPAALRLGFGVGVLALWGEGEPDAGWEGRRDTTAAAAAGLRLAGRVRLVERVRLELALEAFAALPPSGVEGGVALGLPVLAPSLALIWSVP